MESKNIGFSGGETCRECNGEGCCQRQPCLYYPCDFGKTSEEIISNVAGALEDGRVSLCYKRAKMELTPQERSLVVAAPGFFDPEFYDGQSTVVLTDELRERHGKNYCLFWREDQGCIAPKQPLGGRIYSCSKLRTALGKDYDTKNKEITEYINDNPELSSWAPYQKQLRELGGVAISSVRLTSEK